jgi:hypothetical protein
MSRFRIEGDEGPHAGETLIALGDMFVIASETERQGDPRRRRITRYRTLRPGARVYNEAGELLYRQPPNEDD